MISAITGRLQSISKQTATLEVGPLRLEVLVCAAEIATLTAAIGSSLTFHTILYLEGDASRGNLEPRMIGFSNPQDKAFFEKFTTVKGIGPKTALRALSVPVSQIASAIESRNARFLTSLNGIGKRTAELIIAELSGKVASFASSSLQQTSASGRPIQTQYTNAELDAINALVSLGERRPDAERLLQSVRDTSPDINSSDALLREMLRIRRG